MIRNIITAALCCALGLSGVLGWLWWSQKGENALLTQENASLTRSLAAVKLQQERAAEARDVAKAHADRWERRAAEVQATLDTLTEGVTDAPLDPALADRLNRLRDRNAD